MKIFCIELLANLLDWANVFISSNFFLTLLATFTGAYVAQKVAEVENKNKILLSEIRNTNAAIMMAFDICNAYLAFKNQHVADLKKNYDSHKSLYKELEEKKLRGEKVERQALQVDFRTFQIFSTPIRALEEKVYKEVSLSNAVLNFVSILARCIDNLNDSIVHRNRIIEQLKANALTSSQDISAIYLGIRSNAGHADETYASLVEAIFQQTDDCIIYSKAICEDLVKHAINLKKDFGRKSPAINFPNFHESEEKGLIPNIQNYESVFGKFKKQ